MMFLKAWIIGIVIAAPVGPVALLLIQKTLKNGFKEGISVGLGAAIANGLYGFIAAFSLTALSSILREKSFALKLLGGIMLLYLAYKEFIPKPVKSEIQTKSSSLVAHVFFINLGNPVTILSFLAVFTSIECNATSITEGILIAFCIFLGAISWWFLVCSVLQSIRHKISQVGMSRLRYISITTFCLLGLFSLLGCIL